MPLASLSDSPAGVTSRSRSPLRHASVTGVWLSLGLAARGLGSAWQALGRVRIPGRSLRVTQAESPGRVAGRAPGSPSACGRWQQWRLRPPGPPRRRRRRDSRSRSPLRPASVTGVPVWLSLGLAALAQPPGRLRAESESESLAAASESLRGSLIVFGIYYGNYFYYHKIICIIRIANYYFYYCI